MALSSSVGVTTGVKRPREEAAEQGIGEPLSKRAKLDKKITNLRELIPKIQQEDDKKVIIEVQTLEGITSFKLKKFQLFSLSSHFRNVFSQTWKEGQTYTMRWVGTGTMPNIHPQAAAQIIQLAQKGTDIRASQCRSLAELKNDYPDEFPVIFHDIVRLCDYYQIEDLKEECVDFFLNELGSDILKTMSDYLPMILHTEFNSFFSDCLANHLNTVDALLKFIPVLGQLYQANYPDFEIEEVRAIQAYLRNWFERIIEIPELKSPWSGDLAAHEFELSIGLCTALTDFYPHFDFSMGTLLAMQKVIPLKTIGFPFVKDVMNLVYLLVNKSFVFFPEPVSIMDNPEGFIRAQEYVELVEALQSPIARRMEIIDRFIERHPENVMALAIRGLYHFQDRHLAAAMGDYHRALQHHPNFAFAMSRKGVCLLELRQNVAGIAHLDRALELDPFDTYALGARGEVYRKTGMLDLALDHLNRAIHNDPSNVFARVFRAQANMTTGELDLALYDLNWILHRRPYFKLALECRGQCYMRMNAFDRAMRDFDRLLAIEPDHPSWSFNIGKCYAMIGNFDAALPYVEYILQRDPNHVEALTLCGLIYKNKNDLDLALDFLDRAIDLAPKHVTALAVRAECYMETGNFDAASANLESALQIDPGSEEILKIKKKCAEMKAKSKPRL